MSDNSVNNKRIVKNTTYMYFRMFLTTIVAFFTVRVVINTLGHEDYGLYGVIGGLVMTLSVVTNVLVNASQRFFAIELGKNDPVQLKKVFSSIIILYSFVCVALFIIAETIGLWFLLYKMTIPENRMDAVLWVYQFSIASFLLSLLMNPFQAIVIARENMSLYAYLSIADVLLKLGIVYILCLVDMDKLKLYSLLMFSTLAIIQFFYFIYTLKRYPETHIKPQINKDILTSIGSYCSWTLFGSLAYVCNTQGLNIIFNLYFGPLVNAAYTVGNQIKAHVVSFGNNFFAAVRPAMTKSFAKDDINYTKKLFYYSTKVIFSLLFVIMLPLVIEIDYVLHIWLGNVGEHMASFTRLMLIYSLILCISEPITTIVQAAGLVKTYHVCVDGFTLLTLPVSYFLFKYYNNPELAFYISIGIFVIAHYIRLIVLKKVLPIEINEYNRKIVFPSMLSAAICSLLSFSLRYLLEENFYSFIIVCFTSVIITICCIYYIVFNKGERRMVRDLIISKITNVH